MPSPEDLRAWQAALQIAVRTRKLFAHFPARGYAELRDQMTRSSESIANNIAEGRASAFDGEYVRFLDTAARSANELSSQLRTAMEYRIVPKWEAFNLNGTVICTRRMIESLRDTVQAKRGREEPSGRGLEPPTQDAPRPGKPTQNKRTQGKRTQNKRKQGKRKQGKRKNNSTE